jgi:hypothetical protein
VVVGEFAGAAVAADQQLATAGPLVGEVDDGPVVEAMALARDPAESFCQARLGASLAGVSARNFPAPVMTSCEQATARM